MAGSTESVARLQATVSLLRESTLTVESLPSRQVSRPAASRRRNLRFDLDPQSPLDGIIAYLTEQCGENVHDAGVIEITSSSIVRDPNGALVYHPKWVADFGASEHFGTEPEANPWICFNFKGRRIIPTH
jgi:hypothetical protein